MAKRARHSGPAKRGGERRSSPESAAAVPAARAPDPALLAGLALEDFTLSQLRFIDELLADPRLIAAEAARKAYPNMTDKDATAMASENLRKPHIAAEIKRRLAPAMAKLGLEREHVLREIARGLNYDVADAYNADGTFKALRDMPVDVRRQIESVEVEEIRLGEVVIGKVKKVKFSPRREYVTLAARHHKLLVDKIEIHDATGRADRIRKARERAGK